MAVPGFGGQATAAVVSELEEALAGIEPLFPQRIFCRCEGQAVSPKMLPCQIQLQIFLEDATIGVFLDGSPIHREARNVTQHTWLSVRHDLHY